jgi:hypothetical protein
VDDIKCGGKQINGIILAKIFLRGENFNYFLCTAQDHTHYKAAIHTIFSFLKLNIGSHISYNMFADQNLSDFSSALTRKEKLSTAKEIFDYPPHGTPIVLPHYIIFLHIEKCVPFPVPLLF